jgi:hypothetical protein
MAELGEAHRRLIATRKNRRRAELVNQDLVRIVVRTHLRWHQIYCDVFMRYIGPEGFEDTKVLKVRQCCDQGLWTIERWRVRFI